MRHDGDEHRRRPRGTRSIVLGVAVVSIAGAACTSSAAGSDGSPPPSVTASASTEPAPPIPQPEVPGNLPLAPESQRVDTTMPTFSDPTNVTNPLFPVSLQESVLLLGKVDGLPFRTEVTLLPETRIVEWEGMRVEVLVSQYCAFLDGRITELAYDLYAQADDGSVWYFGEDVFDFRDGAIFVTEGSWLVRRDGPAAMIMPGDPGVGDVYRPENAPGFVFEEVTVKSVSETLDGPLGPIEGGMLSSELHRDGSREGKIFAPGYGEFYTAGGSDVEALALAVPTDATSGSIPAKLTRMSDGALSVLDAAGAGNWKAASAAISDITAAWRAYPAGEVPRLIGPRMDAALDALAIGIKERSAEAQNAAIEVARLSYDLQLRYRPVTEIDLARMDLWAAQLQVDEAAGDADGGRGGCVRARLRPRPDPPRAGRRHDGSPEHRARCYPGRGGRRGARRRS
jgi:hypothetical protein